ncbi:hypothetical protein A0W34_01010 [Rhodococcus sp. BH4]|nr:hypothetical protein A0W34_01010 [Rhodococcus sp. BH4]
MDAAAGVGPDGVDSGVEGSASEASVHAEVALAAGAAEGAEDIRSRRSPVHGTGHGSQET